MAEEQKSIMELAGGARPIDGQQVYNLVDSAFNKKLAPRIVALESKIDALNVQVRKLTEALESKNATTKTGK